MNAHIERGFKNVFYVKLCENSCFEWFRLENEFTTEAWNSSRLFICKQILNLLVLLCIFKWKLALPFWCTRVNCGENSASFIQEKRASCMRSLTEKDGKKKETFHSGSRWERQIRFASLDPLSNNRSKMKTDFTALFAFDIFQLTRHVRKASVRRLVLKNNFHDTNTKSVRKFTTELNSKLSGNLQSSSR